MPYLRIATEEAFATPELLERWRVLLREGHNLDPGFVGQWSYFLGPSPRAQGIAARIADLGEQRLRDMDATGIARQVLSLTNPGVQIFDGHTATALAISSNDQLAEAIRKHPDRYSGLAAIAPQNPGGAAQELERAVRKLGLGIEVIEIFEASGSKKRIAGVSDGALDATFFVTARDRHGARFIAILPGKAQQGRMETDRVAAPFQHHAFEIVVQVRHGEHRAMR